MLGRRPWLAPPSDRCSQCCSPAWPRRPGAGARPRQRGPDGLAAARLYRGRLSAARFAAARSSARPNMREMREFSASVSEQDRRAARPIRRKAALLGRAPSGCKARSTPRPRPPEVAGAAAALGARLLAAYPVPLGPTQRARPRARRRALSRRIAPAATAPRATRRPPMARQLDPPPIAFADRERARERSLFALYQVIARASKARRCRASPQLPEADSWALAFHAGRFAYPDALAGAGQGDLGRAIRPSARAVPDLDALSSLSERQLARARSAPTRRRPVIAYLRANPDALAAQGVESLDHRPRPARRKPRRLSRRATATRPSGSRCPPISTASSRSKPCSAPATPALMARVEQAMGELRAGDRRGKRPGRRRARGSPSSKPCSTRPKPRSRPDQASGASTFLGAFTILLREGLEALLVVVAMIAFLRKAERPRAAAATSMAAGSARWSPASLTWWAAT